MLRLNYLPLVFLAALLAMPAQAAGPKSLGKSGFWSSYSLGEGKQAVCYMSLSAKPPQPKNVSKAAKRGEVVLMITHRPAEDATDVVSYTAGLKFKPSSDVALKIGAKQFDLFTQGDTAWSRDAATDHALAAAIRAGQSLTITGVAASGAPIADTLNLKGADAAYVTVGKACGLKVEEPKPAPKKPAKNSAAVKHK